MRLLDYKNVLKFVKNEEIAAIENEVLTAREKLMNKTGKGSDFVGWVNYPNEISQAEVERINSTAQRIKEDSQILLVIGIGGSYLGAKAAISMLTPYLRKEGDLEIIFLGNTLSSTYTKEIFEYVQDKDFSINIISKSGTTTEPAIAFRLFKTLLEKKYGEDYYKRIYSTTTIGKGVLYNLSVENKYEIFSIPEDIGGRYSVLTAVGLLPIAACGIDINEMLRGAQEAYQLFSTSDFLENDALVYAALRNILNRRGKEIEVLVTYEPKLSFFGEWYKQLFGESEGKDGLGIYPSSVAYTTDLHSLGQYVQDGRRILFETVIQVLDPELEIIIEKEKVDFDGLNYLAGKTLDEVNNQALNGTVLAHVDGGVPNMILRVPSLDAYNFGYLAYFFMFSCGVSGYILGINPFDQEGVEAYKKNMFALLGKEGYQELKEELLKKLKG
jgi:glucose-6-phosphate isomerase